MGFSLFPREEDFFTLFRKQGELVHQSCDQLHEMMEHFDRLEERAKEMKEVEHQGDLVTHEIFERLNRTFITPLEREDIHDLASGLDDVVDAAEAIGSRLLLFGVTESRPEAVRMTEILVASARQIEQAVENLRNLQNLMSFTIEIHRLENEGDRLYRDAVAALFANGIDPMVVIRWKDIFESLEASVDACETVAHVLEGITLKRRRR